MVVLLHTFTQSCIFRTLSSVYDCTPKTHKKTPGDFLMDFSLVLSGRRMQISYHKHKKRRGYDAYAIPPYAI